MTFPTLYELEPIGVGGAHEAIAALHFCSEDCRARYRRAEGQAYSEGIEELSVDGELCERCNRPLEIPE